MDVERRRPRNRKTGSNRRSLACGDHHGRERALGGGSRFTAGGRPSPGRRGVTPCGPRRQRTRHSVPDDFLLQLGKLVASGDRNRRPVRPAQALHPQRSGDAASRWRQGTGDRRARRTGAGHLRALERSGRTDQGQYQASSRRRVQLGSRQEIAQAAQRLAREVADGKRDPASIDADALGQYLDAPDIPDPDLIIRTSGEQRLSNFLMWQAAYSELVFVPIHWPDFDKDALESAIAEYARRERRFGGLAVKTGS